MYWDEGMKERMKLVEGSWGSRDAKTEERENEECRAKGMEGEGTEKKNNGGVEGSKNGAR